MTNGWTPERRARQAALIRKWQPWSNSTGPKTAAALPYSADLALQHAKEVRILNSPYALPIDAAGSTFLSFAPKAGCMPRSKNETLSIRTTAEIKGLLRQAAGRERRSVASMIEVLVLANVSEHKLGPGMSAARRTKSR